MMERTAFGILWSTPWRLKELASRAVMTDGTSAEKRQIAWQCINHSVGKVEDTW